MPYPFQDNDPDHLPEHDRLYEQVPPVVSATGGLFLADDGHYKTPPGSSLNSPAFTGTPTAPTPAGGDATARLATTAFVTDAVTVAATAETNLCTDPSFESGTGAWIAQTSTIGTSTVEARSGAQSMLVTLTNTVGAGAYVSFTQVVGASYSLSAWVFAPVSVTVKIAYTGGSVTSGGTAVTLTAGVWTPLKVVGSATATTGYASVITTVAEPSGSLLYVDDAMINATPTKGDLYVINTAGAPTRQPVGTDGQVLTADSSQPNGVKWAPIPAAGTTANRPAINGRSGLSYFDTTLNKPIWSNAAGTGWVDATGATV